MDKTHHNLEVHWDQDLVVAVMLQTVAVALLLQQEEDQDLLVDMVDMVVLEVETVVAVVAEAKVVLAVVLVDLMVWVLLVQQDSLDNPVVKV